MPGDNPVSEPINEPEEVPLVVLLSEVVGLAVVLQQTPLTEIGAPPLLVMSPPQVAVFDVIAETEFVEIVANVEPVIKIT